MTIMIAAPPPPFDPSIYPSPYYRHVHATLITVKHHSGKGFIVWNWNSTCWEDKTDEEVDQLRIEQTEFFSIVDEVDRVDDRFVRDTEELQQGLADGSISLTVSHEEATDD